MKIVLLQDVKSVGKKGDIVNVSDGYARNFILPKHLGEEVSNASLAKLSGQKKYEEKVNAQMLADAKELAEKIEEKGIELSVKVGEGGKIFGSISSKEISAAVMSQRNLEIDKKKIVLPDPIKTVGEHEVKIKLHREVTATLKIVVKEA